jgi:molybdate transport repressor ModE-like protein
LAYNYIAISASEACWTGAPRCPISICSGGPGERHRHALAHLGNAERGFGRSLVARARGGNDRGGAALTPAAQDFLGRYTRFRDRPDREVERLYRHALRRTAR